MSTVDAFAGALAEPVARNAVRSPSAQILKPCVMVLAAALLSLPLNGVVAYSIGKEWEESRRYRGNYAEPKDTIDWASKERDWAILMDYALHSDELNDVIFLGDSACMEGFVPLSFEEATGLKAYNLAAKGILGMEGMIVVLRRYLENHPPPRVVVFSVAPESLERIYQVSKDDAEAVEHFLWCFGPGTQEYRPKHEHPIASYTRLGIWGARRHFQSRLGRYAGEFKERKEFRHRERGYWEGSDLGLKFDNPAHFLEEPSSITPAFQASLTKLIGLTQEHNILLFIRLAPVPPGTGPKNTAFVNAWPKEVEDRFAKVIVSRPLILHEEVGLFVDPVHCNRRGAEKLTARTAREVRNLLNME